MRRLFQLAIMLAVASAVPASPIVLAEIQKAAAPAQKEKVETTVTVEVKQGVAAKVVEKKAVKVEKKPQPAEEVAILKAMDNDVDPNQEPQVRQFMQQFRPAMRSEYYFLRTVCAPTPEQRKLIAREGEKALREASKAFVEAQSRPMQVRNGRAVYPDPRKLIEGAMARAVGPHLSADQAARYAAEAEKRAADRRRAAARNIVAKLDQDLVLNADQRTRIGEAMLAQWDDSWCQSLETLLYGDQYYPRLPDNVVVGYLDAKQMEVWHGNQPNQNYFFGFVGNMMPQEDPQDDKELIEARVAAERAQPMLPGRRNGIPNVLVPAAPAVPGAAKVVPRKKAAVVPGKKAAPAAVKDAPPK